MAQLYFSLGDEPNAKQHMNIALSMMSEVTVIEDELVNLRNNKPDYNTEVDAHLSMGIKSKMTKISTCEGKTEETNCEGKTEESVDEGKTEESFDDEEEDWVWQDCSSS
jgi:hypothetical protein